MPQKTIATKEQKEVIYYFVDVLEGRENGITLTQCSQKLKLNKATITKYIDSYREEIKNDGKDLSNHKDELREKYKDKTFDEVFPKPLSNNNLKKTSKQQIDLTETNNALKDIVNALSNLKINEDTIKLIEKDLVSELYKLIQEQKLQIDDNTIQNLFYNQCFINGLNNYYCNAINPLFEQYNLLETRIRTLEEILSK